MEHVQVELSKNVHRNTKYVTVPNCVIYRTVHVSAEPLRIFLFCFIYMSILIC